MDGLTKSGNTNSHSAAYGNKDEDIQELTEQYVRMATEDTSDVSDNDFDENKDDFYSASDGERDDQALQELADEVDAEKRTTHETEYRQNIGDKTDIFSNHGVLIHDNDGKFHIEERKSDIVFSDKEFISSANEVNYPAGNSVCDIHQYSTNKVTTDEANGCKVLTANHTIVDSTNIKQVDKCEEPLTLSSCNLAEKEIVNCVADNSITECQESDNVKQSDKISDDESHENDIKEKEAAMTEEEQEYLSEAVGFKTTGNLAFKNGNYHEAIELYDKGLNVCPLQFAEHRSIMFSNRAACLMAKADYNGAIEDSTKSIELQPQYIKAIRRRAQAYEKTEKLDDALKDYKTIHDIEPRNAENIHTCLRLEHEINERNEKLKTEMLGKLKDLGNMVLRPFGLSTNNFNLEENAETGSYSVQFKQNPGN